MRQYFGKLSFNALDDVSLFMLFCFTVGTIASQQTTISLKQLWRGGYQTQSLPAFYSFQNGKSYSVLRQNYSSGESAILQYDYTTGKQVDTLLVNTKFRDLPRFVSYTFSKQEDKLLLGTAIDPIYRRSSRGIYFVLDRNTQQLLQIHKQQIQEPTFSPDGKKIAYVLAHNLYIFDLKTQKHTQITTDGQPNKIRNGISDWVYEEEFSIVRVFDWNASSDKIAWLRFDETAVATFGMTVYETNLYPESQHFKYPKAGEKNAEVSLHIADLKTTETFAVPLQKYQIEYVPRLLWTPDPNLLSFQVLNRHQNALKLLLFDAKSRETKLLLSEQDAAYIDIREDLTFLKDQSFIWTSEKDGFRHLYHYDKNGKLIKQLTKGPWEITAFYGYDSKRKKLFFQSVENGSSRRDLYSIALNGKNKKQLGTESGTHRAQFSADYSQYIDHFSNTTTPDRYTLCDSDSGEAIRLIEANTQLARQIKSLALPQKKISTLDVRGELLNMWIIKPPNFDPQKVYPLLMHQYSGPGSQSVQNRWHHPNDYWFMHLAQKGYIIACVDGRGTGYKGAKFKKSTQLQLGKLELEDQIAAAQKLGKLPYIDSSRIGIWGWSYGGFMASNCIFKAPEVFKMAIAVAPVTNWRFYDTIYTERYLKTPQENTKGYDQNSPIHFADGLEGKFLLIHGSADDNVHLQNSMRLIEALVQANKDFEWAIYPDKNHGIYGGNTRLHLYNKMTRFILKNL